MDNPNQSLIPLFNPLTEDFEYPMRDDSNNFSTFKMPSKEVSYFEPHVARHMKKHLADAVYNKEGNPKRDRDLEMADIYARIEVTDD